jgi:hypothetical protein
MTKGKSRDSLYTVDMRGVIRKLLAIWSAKKLLGNVHEDGDDKQRKRNISAEVSKRNAHE